MASITDNRHRGKKNGRRTVQFVGIDGRRRSIRLGKASLDIARSVKMRVEAIVSAQHAGVPVDVETAAWLGKTSDLIHKRLARVGLALPRASSLIAGGPSGRTITDLCETFRDSRLLLKASTKRVNEFGATNLVEFFGSKYGVAKVTEADAQVFADWLRAPEAATKERPDGTIALNGKGLALATARKRCSLAKQIFGFAKDSRWIDTNPFAGIRTANVGNRERQTFVTREVSSNVLEALPDGEWRTTFALARLGGLRAPSETGNLRLDAVDWDRERILVASPKTEHHQGGESREIPLFPELRPYLREAFENAEGGQLYFTPRLRGKNVGTLLRKILVRIGVKPWAKPFQNLRLSRQTELESEFPRHVVCAWMGNSAQVAEESYLLVIEADFAKAVRKVTHPTGERRGTSAKKSPKYPAKTRKSR